MIHLSPEQGGLLYEMLSNFGDDARLMAIRDQISAQLNAPNHTSDLLETVAQLVSNGRARSVMSGTVLDALRSAILNPREMARLRALAKDHAGCVRCGKSLAHGELSTASEGGPLCARCYIPIQHACPACDTKLTFPNSVTRIIQKNIKECKVCAERGAAPEKKMEEDPVATRIMDLANELADQRMRERAARPRRPPVPPIAQANGMDFVWQPLTDVAQQGRPAGPPTATRNPFPDAARLEEAIFGAAPRRFEEDDEED